MSILYHPRPGEIFICSYPQDMRKPEMVKVRPVVVISPRIKYRNNLSTVVPLSASEPRRKMPYHYELNLDNPLPERWNKNPCWAICDHSMAVGSDRLDLIRLGKDHTGKRRYYQHKIGAEDLHNIRLSVLHSIGLGHLIG